ncbi:MAG: hypothetical protein E6Q92_01140 [Burkholderiaceae bacterium]|nr:MAG: hypothetical protein E6Q92_01140 [Burkholderiaceae bacterium]
MRVMKMMALVAVTAAVSACASVPSPSEVVGWRFVKADIHSYPLVILSVDGKGQLDQVVRLDPGVRQLQVQAPPTPTRRHGLVQPYQLDVKPCTRYYLVAVKENELSNQFSVRIDAEEALAACTPPVLPH